MTIQSVPVNRTSAWLRPLYLIAGLLSLGVGVVGIFLPLIPTTGPLLLAAFFFARSSARLHSWLVNHPRFGRFISDFQSERVIPRRAKIVALVAMTVAFTYALVWVTTHLALRLVVGAVALWALWFVARLPTKRTANSGAEPQAASR